jgi:hypothetical protein
MIPANVDFNDPEWLGARLELAKSLVCVGAKAKIVERLTGVTHVFVTKMYRQIHNTNPPAGVVVTGTPQLFAGQSKNATASLAVSTAIFLNCYQQIGNLTKWSVDSGWHLMAAFESYQDQIRSVPDTYRRLDINLAWASLGWAGFSRVSANAKIRLHRCPACLMHYPIVAALLPDAQDCPLCAINATKRDTTVVSPSRLVAAGRY